MCISSSVDATKTFNGVIYVINILFQTEDSLVLDDRFDPPRRQHLLRALLDHHQGQGCLPLFPKLETPIKLLVLPMSHFEP